MEAALAEYREDSHRESTSPWHIDNMQRRSGPRILHYCGGSMEVIGRLHELGQAPLDTFHAVAGLGLALVIRICVWSLGAWQANWPYPCSGKPFAASQCCGPDQGHSTSRPRPVKPQLAPELECVPVRY